MQKKIAQKKTTLLALEISPKGMIKKTSRCGRQAVHNEWRKTKNAREQQRSEAYERGEDPQAGDLEGYEGA